MRVAFVGVGHHHYRAYLRPVLSRGEDRVVGVSDRNPEVARLESEELGCTWSGDYRELVRTQHPDFVFALGRHCDMAEEADFLLDEGIPFAIEKPAGMNYGEVSALARKAQAKGAFAAPGLAMRYSDLAEMIRQDLSDDTFEYVLFRWFGPSGARYEDPRWQWQFVPSEGGGGALINLGVHHVDWFRTLVGDREVRVTSAIVGNAAEGRAVEDYCLVSVRAGGTLGILESGYLSAGALTEVPGGVPGLTSRIPVPSNPPDMHYVLRTDRHHILVHEPRKATVVDLRTGSVRDVEGSTTQSYELFVSDVLGRAQEGKLPRVDLVDMADVMRIVDEAYRVGGPLAPISGAAGSVAQ